MKTLGNTTGSQTKDNVKDLKFWGDLDTFKLISKVWSEKEGWMKSTKAMEIDGVGCVVQVTTQQLNDTGMFTYKEEQEGEDLVMLDTTKTMKQSVVAEALIFVPGVWIKEEKDKNGKIISRKLKGGNA